MRRITRVSRRSSGLSEPVPPGQQLLVYRVGPDEFGRDRPLRGVRQQRSVLPATEPAMRPGELLERRYLLGARVQRAVDDEVTHVRQPVVPAQIVDRVRAERPERVVAVDLPLV